MKVECTPNSAQVKQQHFMLLGGCLSSPEVDERMTKRMFGREFKIRVVRELESGRKGSVVCRQYGIARDMLSRWSKEYRENPRDAFKGSGTTCDKDLKLAEYERLIGKLYAQIDYLKKNIALEEERKLEEQRFRK